MLTVTRKDRLKGQAYGACACAFFTLLVMSCSSHPVAQHVSVSAPDWYNDPPTDDRDWFYGRGSGANKDLARTRALGEIASKLIVEIEGTQEYRILAQQADVSQTYREKFKARIKNRPIPGAEAVKESCVAISQCFALYRVSRQRLGDNLTAEIQKRQALYERRLSALAGVVAAQRYRDTLWLRTQAQTLTDLALARQAALPLAESGSTMASGERLVEATAFYERAKSNLMVGFSAPASLGDLPTKLASSLGEKGIAASARADSRTNLQVTLQPTFKDSVSFGDLRTRLVVALTGRDERGNIFFTRRFEAEGVSLESHQEAHAFAIATIAAKITEEVGIIDALNLVATDE